MECIVVTCQDMVKGNIAVAKYADVAIDLSMNETMHKAVKCDTCMRCGAVRCDAMLCYAMLCYAMLCYAMLCYATM